MKVLALDFVADYKLELVIDSTTEVEAVTDIIEARRWVILYSHLLE